MSHSVQAATAQNLPMPKAVRPALLLRVIALTRQHLRLLLCGLGGLIGGSAITLTFPEVVRRYLNVHDLIVDAARLSEVCLILCGLFVIQAICFYVRSYSLGLLGQKVVAEVRSKLYRSIILREIEFFDRARTGDLVSRLSADTALLQDVVSIKLSMFLRYSLQVLIGTILMSFLSLRLTFAILLVLPILVGISIVLGRSLKKVSKRQQEELGRATSIAEETIGAARIVKAFNREDFESARFSNSIAETLRLGVERTGVSAFFASFVSLLLNVAIVIVLGYGIILVNAGNLAAGDLTAFFFYGSIVAVSFGFVTGGYPEFLQALGAAERIFELLDQSPTQIAGRPFDKRPHGELEFKQVAFTYPTRLDQEVLHDITFHAAAGKRIALVGPSGSGKTTIVNLLLRFYAPTSGSITLDGIDIGTIDANALRDFIAIVPQEAGLFGISIADNLRYGKANAPLEALRQVCKQANILEFIESLKDGFDTLVGERGAQLSGGQRQRIAIARAMLRDPAVLILDEATSHLDSENEYAVTQALQNLMINRTTLVIAHRLATVKSCDQVIVLEQGNIVQTGTHDELSRATGLYRTLVERQDLSDNAPVFSV